MGRPTVVSDAEIIEAGERIKSTEPVNGTRLWRACGQRGKPDRLLAVWSQHDATQRAEAGDNRQRGGDLPIPEKAQQEAASLKNELSSGIDRVVSSIYLAIEESVQGRYRAEVVEMSRTREEYLREIRDAFAAIEEMTDAVSAAEERLKAVEGALSDALSARNVSEALRAVVVEDQGRVTEQLRQVERDLEHELIERGEVKAVVARAEIETETLRRALDDITADFNSAHAEIEQVRLASASLHDTNIRQAEAVVLKDVEITRIREAAAKTDMALQVWMERAIGAERVPSILSSKLSPTSETSVMRIARRRRANGRSDETESTKTANSDINEMVALVSNASENYTSILERAPR